MRRRRNFQALKRAIGEAVTIETGRGKIVGTLISISREKHLQPETQVDSNFDTKSLRLKLKDVVVDGDGR